jgi:hypothetical protein
MIIYKFQINYKIKIKQKACGNFFFVVTTQLQLGCHEKI